MENPPNCRPTGARTNPVHLMDDFVGGLNMLMYNVPPVLLNWYKQGWRMRSGGAHCNPALAVEVRWCLLGSWCLRLRSGAHWDLVAKSWVRLGIIPHPCSNDLVLTLPLRDLDVFKQKPPRWCHRCPPASIGGCGQATHDTGQWRFFGSAG